VLRSKLGTKGNMAPELHSQQSESYRGPAADVFSASTVLFTMRSKHPPWIEATKHDLWYRCIIKNNAKNFWRRHELEHSKGFYSDDFKSFFIAMAQTDPTLRPTILELLAHPWMNGSTPTQEEVKVELTNRLERVYGAKVAEREEKKRLKRSKTMDQKSEVDDTVSQRSYLSSRFSEMSFVPTKKGATTMLLMTGLLASLMAYLNKRGK
jgi:serine/threonine protein kinase